MSCIECVNMVYQYDITGDFVPFCILQNIEIVNEAAHICSAYKEMPF